MKKTKHLTLHAARYLLGRTGSGTVRAEEKKLGGFFYSTNSLHRTTLYSTLQVRTFPTRGAFILHNGTELINWLALGG